MAVMAGETVSEWIEWEGYGPLWQPGCIAWKDGRITESDAALVLTDGTAKQPREWSADEIRDYVESHDGDLQGFTDLAASIVTESVSFWRCGDDDVVERTARTMTCKVLRWDDPEAAELARMECFDDFDEVAP